MRDPQHKGARSDEPNSSVSSVVSETRCESVDAEGYDAPTIRAQLTARDGDEAVLLNIPIWGWTGDGKTCALLTAIHFCDVREHPLAFAMVRNPEELEAFENSFDEYRGLHLSAAAAATTQRLEDLCEQFIDRCEWPPGTDEPSTYVLAIRDIRRTIAYVAFPDIKGGSFRELDATAREVVRSAHAAVVLVNPELYQQSTTDGKRYRDEILGRMQTFGKAGVPLCLLIAKSDQYKGPSDVAGRTQDQLTIFVEQGGWSSMTRIVRATVVGEDCDMTDNRLPTADARSPEALIQAFVWIVAEALKKPAAESRKVVPTVNIRGLMSSRAATVQTTAISELRLVGDYSNSPGIALCPIDETARGASFAFVNPKGQLLEVFLRAGASEETPTFSAIGLLPEWDPDCEYQGYYAAGEFLIGGRRECNRVWQGAKGGTLTQLSLPNELVAWAPVTSRQLVGLDSKGRLLSVRLASGKMQQVDHVERFVSATDGLACAFVDKNAHVLAFNGESVEGIMLQSDGMFGGRVAPALKCGFKGGEGQTNRLGTCVAVTEDEKAVVSAPDGSIELGTVSEHAIASSAIAASSNMIAVLDAGLRLTVASLGDGEVTLSDSEHSPVLPKCPDSIVWSPSGTVLIVTFPDRTWNLLKPYGIGAE